MVACVISLINSSNAVDWVYMHTCDMSVSIRSFHTQRLMCHMFLLQAGQLCHQPTISTTRLD